MRTKSNKPYGTSSLVIRRLPRYFRYLRILMRDGITKTSSKELSERMNVTASQIRQDFNSFGEFGQPGFGYNVESLYGEICELLGVNEHLNCVLVGAGDLGRALVRSQTFEKRNITVNAMFDINPDLVGKTCNGVPIYHADTMTDYLKNNPVSFAVLAVPKAQAVKTAEECIDCGIRGLWNFTGAELAEFKDKVILENVHLGDSLMTLCYALCYENNKHETESGKK